MKDYRILRLTILVTLLASLIAMVVACVGESESTVIVNEVLIPVEVEVTREVYSTVEVEVTRVVTVTVLVQRTILVGPICQSELDRLREAAMAAKCVIRTPVPTWPAGKPLFPTFTPTPSS